MPINSAEFENNRSAMEEGIKELYEELFGYDVEFYQLDPNQSSGYGREIKFKKYLDPIKMCGRLEEDPTKKTVQICRTLIRNSSIRDISISLLSSLLRTACLPKRTI